MAIYYVVVLIIVIIRVVKMVQNVLKTLPNKSMHVYVEMNGYNRVIIVKMVNNSYLMD
jgi:hypothetical protein